MGSKNERSIGVRASNNKNPESENDDNPLRASKRKVFKIIASEEDYHTVQKRFKQKTLEIRLSHYRKLLQNHSRDASVTNIKQGHPEIE